MQLTMTEHTLAVPPQTTGPVGVSTDSACAALQTSASTVHCRAVMVVCQYPYFEIELCQQPQQECSSPVADQWIERLPQPRATLVSQKEKGRLDA